MKKIQIETTISSPVEKVWKYFNNPEYITQWNFAHESWICPKSENDVRENGRFKTRMEARDGSYGFDFSGTYQIVLPNEKIKYILDDNREVEIFFDKIDDNTTKITEIFDPELENSIEMQKEGWNAILTNFKKYVEEH